MSLRPRRIRRCRRCCFCIAKWWFLSVVGRPYVADAVILGGVRRGGSPDLLRFVVLQQSIVGRPYAADVAILGGVRRGGSPDLRRFVVVRCFPS